VKEFPLMLPGLHGRSWLGILATSHAVEQVEQHCAGQSRYSLVYFIVPFSGVDVAEEYVVPEKIDWQYVKA
jgi:hypothetical protein